MQPKRADSRRHLCQTASIPCIYLSNGSLRSGFALDQSEQTTRVQFPKPITSAAKNTDTKARENSQFVFAFARDQPEHTAQNDWTNHLISVCTTKTETKAWENSSTAKLRLCFVLPVGD